MAAAALVFAVVIAPPGLAGGKPGSSGPKPGGLEMFVSGTLADSDGRPLEAKSAEATAFAFDRADGVASIEVTVDGKRVAIDRLKCKGSCPQSTTFDFKYVAKRYGNDHHDIAMTATDGTGHDLTRYVSIDRKPAGGSGGAPTPVPAFYITAPNENDLSRQVSKAAERVADKQGSGRTLLALDFGAARLKGNTYGSALRSGTFFSNDQIKTALEAAARSYRQHRRRGAITIVYVNTNGNISDPGKGYTKFDKKTARTAGENQGKVVADLKVFPHITAAVGGDIEPGYDSQPGAGDRDGRRRGPRVGRQALLQLRNRSVLRGQLHERLERPAHLRHDDRREQAGCAGDLQRLAGGSGSGLGEDPERLQDRVVPGDEREPARLPRAAAELGAAEEDDRGQRGQRAGGVAQVRLRLAGLALALAFALAGCGGDDGTKPSQLEKELIPAEVVDNPTDFFSSGSLKPIENAWRVSDKERFTQVEAGSISGNDTIGAFAIFRHNFKNAGQTAALVKVIGAGPLKITKAPTGTGVEASAQRNGKIEFSSERGATGTLDLSNDTVTLHAP